MERDFLGLVTNTSSPVIKHEVHDPFILLDHPSVLQRRTGMHWYFPVSSLNSPPDVSSKSHPQERPMRSILDPVPSSQFATASTTDNYSQRNMSSKQSGSKIVSASSLLEHSGARHPSHRFTTEQRIGRSTSNSPSFGRVQSMSPASRVPSLTCFPTYTDSRNSPKRLTAPAQMTIFYAGSVSVYDNIALEKAQEILLLAGNETPSTPASMVPLPSAQPQAQYRKPSLHEIVSNGSPSHVTSSSGLVNHVSIFSQIASQCGGVSNQRTKTSSQQQPESSRAVNSQRSTIGYAIPGPVPQARKASLARFLERRKERVTNSQPYPVELKSSEQERDKSSASDGLSFTLRSPI